MSNEEERKKFIITKEKIDALKEEESKNRKTYVITKEKIDAVLNKSGEESKPRIYSADVAYSLKTDQTYVIAKHADSVDSPGGTHLYVGQGKLEETNVVCEQKTPNAILYFLKTDILQYQGRIVKE